MDSIIIVDFGSQVTQLIARRVREMEVLSFVISPENIMQRIGELRPVGVILSGGPDSVYEEGSKTIDPAIFALGLPILGICYGQQITCRLLGGEVQKGEKREFGRARLLIKKPNSLVKNEGIVWMSHGDLVSRLPEDFEVLAVTENAPYAAIKHKTREVYGVQFHPEVTHSEIGAEILRAFVLEIAGAKQTWKMRNYMEGQVGEIRTKVGEAKAICALSGGVDSAVAAKLVEMAIGERLYCIFVDTGFLRKNEGEEVLAAFPQVIYVNAKEKFYSALKGVCEPEQKRKIIGRLFIECFDEEVKKLAAKGFEGIKFLVQGTIYPDVIESAGTSAAHNIKSHHNVGGLPQEMNLSLLEPLRSLFKDEVRKLGLELGLSAARVYRHPFPGPGLAIRILGEPTEEKVRILQEADAIYMEELHKHGLYSRIWQAFCVLLPCKTVGVMGDGRTYEYVLAIRAVNSSDGMTADFFPFDMGFLGELSARIVNEVRGINRVVYDVTSKPPATIEWE